jgi:hypothetical protein
MSTTEKTDFYVGKPTEKKPPGIKRQKNNFFLLVEIILCRFVFFLSVLRRQENVEPSGLKKLTLSSVTDRKMQHTDRELIFLSTTNAKKKQWLTDSEISFFSRRR